MLPIGEGGLRWIGRFSGEAPGPAWSESLTKA